MKIHPMLVHFPVALLLASVFFDVLGAGILASAGFYGGKLGHGREGMERGRREFRMDSPAGADLPFDNDQAGNFDGMPGGGAGDGSLR